MSSSSWNCIVQPLIENETTSSARSIQSSLATTQRRPLYRSLIKRGYFKWRTFCQVCVLSGWGFHMPRKKHRVSLLLTCFLSMRGGMKMILFFANTLQVIAINVNYIILIWLQLIRNLIKVTCYWCSR